MEGKIRKSLLLAMMAFAPSVALGLGTLEVDSLGFLRSSQERGDSTFILSASPDVKTDGDFFAAALSGRALLFADDPSSFSVEAFEAYVATPSRFSRLHQVSLGRRRYDWSRADDEWNLALWNPRFVWDPLRPVQVGLTGLFYSYESAKWRLLAYASPIAVPERGVPVQDEDGRISAPGPFWIAPAERLALDDREIDIRYRLQYPPVGQLLFRPSAALSMRYGASRGVWASATYGMVPVHIPELAVEGALDPGKMVFNATIHPQLYSRHVLTAETGYRAGSWSVWASLSGDSPIRKPARSDWITLSSGPALIAAWGGDLSWTGGLKIRASYLSVVENRAAIRPEAADLATSSRFNFRRAWKLGGSWKGSSPLSYDVSWIYDDEHSSGFVSVDLGYTGGIGARWSLGLGADIIATSTGTGWIGQYQGDDRVRGKVGYAF